MQFNFAPVRILPQKSSGLGEFFSIVGGGWISSACLPFSTPLGQKLISAVAQIVLSSPLTWLHRKEALDTVFKERRSSYREISKAQGLHLCAHSNCAVGRLGTISCFNSKLEMSVRSSKTIGWPT